MQKMFSFCDSHDITKMFRLIAEMKEVLTAIDAGEIPNQTDYSAQDLVNYCTSLVKGQRRNLGRTKPGSWAVAPNDDEMSSDARVDFIFVPTYVTVATLSRILHDFPWIAIQVPGFYRSLKSGLKFCTYRELRGSGYEAIDGILDAIMILAIGKVPALLEVAPQFSPKLRKVFEEVERFLSDNLSTGETFGPWGMDYSQGYQAALETLYLSKDKDLIGSIEQARHAGINGCVKELEW